MKEQASHTVDQAIVLNAISEAHLSEPVVDWLTNESTYLAQLINVYIKNPDTFNLHEDIRRDPSLLLQTILYSAETLYTYQEAYNKALVELAQANRIQYSDIDEIPQFLQDISVEREKEKLQHQINEGGNVAIGLMGSGASGKGTIGKKTGMQRAVNTTTRFVRPGEVHGQDYLYIRVMEPQVAETLDIDTGIADGTNYFEKYGPYVTTVHRPGRALHGTSISEFTRHFEAGERVMFFEHGPVQVEEAAQKMSELVPNTIVMPVCILPPRSGILPLASRIAVRTYGDPNHGDPTVTEGYKIKDTYLASTIGPGQIEELAYTARFTQGNNPLGIAYIVNDDLNEAVQLMKNLISVS